MSVLLRPRCPRGCVCSMAWRARRRLANAIAAKAWLVASPHAIAATAAARELDTVDARRYGVLYIGPSIEEAVCLCPLLRPLQALRGIGTLVFGAVQRSIRDPHRKMTLWRKRFRFAMNKSDNAWHDRLTDSLVKFETVKYFTAELFQRTIFPEIARTRRAP